MQENLVIVESPAKAKTIEKFLGKGYVVKSSFGHIRDLSKKELGIDIQNDFTPHYEISPDKKKTVAELEKLAKEAGTVWLASDEDREGEAIAWHLSQVLGLKDDKTKRIVFHEITKNAILHAIENPRTIDLNLVNAQRAKYGLTALKMGDDALTAAAQTRAEEIAVVNSHVRPDGSKCFTVLKDYGVTDTPTGENAAWGSVSPEEVVNAWMNSEGHRANILNPEARKMSVGYYYNSNSTWGHQWIQIFTK